MSGNILGGNFLCVNFPEGGGFSRGSLMGANFSGGSFLGDGGGGKFPRTVCSEYNFF